ncbi:MAG: hypothetical protein HFJ23_06245 [Clostridia bacterium]|nr:hypothetical protein [Clostridia bacterium]
MILKLLHELICKGGKQERQRYYYIKERNEVKYFFSSDVELREQDLREAMEIIQSNVSKQVAGSVTASQLVDCFKASGVLAVDFQMRDEGRGWLIKLSDYPLAFRS